MLRITDRIEKETAAVSTTKHTKINTRRRGPPSVAKE